MSGYKTVEIPVPLRGINQDENPNALGDADLIEAQNVWFRGHTAGTRPGLEDESSGEDYHTAIAGTPVIQSGYEFRATLDTVRKHVVVAGGKLYSTHDTEIVKNSTGAPATISSGADYIWTFAEHKDILYAAGGKDADTIWKWDGLAGTADAVKVLSDTDGDGVGNAGNIDAKFIYQKWNYGWLCGLNGTKPDDNPMVARYSALNDMDTWPVGNTIGGSSAVGGFDSYGDNYTTGFGSWTDNKGDWMLVLTRKVIYSVVQTSDPLMPFYIDSVIQNGCVHQNAFVSLGTDSGEAIYISESGIHSLRQSQQHGSRADKFLSWPIRKLFQGLRRNRLKLACGAYWPDEGVVAFLVTHGHSNSAHNLMLCLDVRNKEELTSDTARWTVWKPSLDLNRIWTARSGTGYTTAPNRVFLYAGAKTTGNVCRFNPDSGSYSDRGTAYTTKIQTAHRNFGVPGVEKGLGDVWLHMQRGTGSAFTPTLIPIFDYGSRYGLPIPLTMELSGSKFGTGRFGTARFGGVNSVQVKHLYGSGAGDSIGWKIETTGVNQAFFLTSLAYQVAGTGEDRGD